MTWETGLFLHKIPYIKGGAGPRTMVFFYGGSALLTSLTKSSIKNYLNAVRQYVPQGYTYYIFGYEEQPAKDYSLNQITDDFARIIKTEIGTAIIVGISFGGFVAIRFAAKYPELTEKLVLLITAHRFSANGERKVNRMLELAKQENFYALIKEYSLLFRRPWLNLLARFFIWKNKEDILRGLKSSDAIINSLTGIFSEDVRRNFACLNVIQAKTLVIGGTLDQFFGIDEFKATADAIKGAKLQIFKNETHMLPLERKSDVSKLVKEFVANT
ncbi:MAG: alpha/beta hydrolase [Negativicutes bacterium]|nr:alpha/beta hydrolase [Negativicutes bacterium]